MCGFAGQWRLQADQPRDVLIDAVQRMNQRLVHRGPDDAGIWADEATGIALGHRRLSILDLSRDGAQPMVSADGRWVLVYNGEVYNFAALRRELERLGQRFRGGSDTEVLLAALSEWGLPQAASRAVGMFAFAAWDREKRRLLLCRDRMGEKPLYYGRLPDGTLVFASELKALRSHPGWQGSVDRGALSLFLRHNYIPDPYSIYSNVRKLPPGSWLELPEPGSPQSYWSLEQNAVNALADPLAGDEAEALDAVDAVLREAVATQMVADVPLGAFLSGGIDSSLVVSMMQSLSPRPIRTFSIGSDDSSVDESGFARAVARHLGTEHTELCVRPADALNTIPALPQIYDEPFADPSQIPTFIVSRLARQHVTVALSGDGGDELFGGYQRYLLARRLWRTTGWIPGHLRRAFASTITAASGFTDPHGSVTARLQKSAHVLGVADSVGLYLRLMTSWWEEVTPVIGAIDAPTLLSQRSAWPPLSDAVLLMMYLDTAVYLPGAILTKVDRAAMHVSLETRAPFLDHRVVELAWRIPVTLKFRQGRGKWVLRRLLDRYVPRHLVDRPKRGFGIPLAQWLRGPLRSWAEDLLDEGRVRSEGYLDPVSVRTQWQAHLRGDQDRDWVLWSILMFQAWLRADARG
jgi:asparagine synthase (glutamine-hydrolysing)